MMEFLVSTGLVGNLDFWIEALAVFVIIAGSILILVLRPEEAIVNSDAVGAMMVIGLTAVMACFSIF